MINLRNSPFLWFALVLLLAYGAVSLTSLHLTPWMNRVLWVVCFACSMISLLKFEPGKQMRSTLAIGVLIFTAGLIRVTQFGTEIFPGDPILMETRMHGIVRVTEVLKEKENSVSLKCQQLNLRNQYGEIQSSLADKYLVVQIREIDSSEIFPGDTFYVSGWVSALKGPSNPHAFDVRTYYRSIGIRHQLNCKGNEARQLPGTPNSLSRLTAQWQHFLCGIVKANTTLEVSQLTNALVWGDRTYMNDEIRDAFANSGAMHVLSVSGMHMAMIYSMLYLLLGAPGSGSFPRRMLRLCMYAMAILLYMGLTGACPAVVRSGLMILLYLLGKAMGWNTQIWNLLGFAAFLMLWINPYVCQNMGFQLSFLAMAGILLYARPIIRYLSFKHILLHRVWEITAVSIAAQIFILPILLHHFFQFPLTFVASSLVAMPASYVVIFGTLINVCLSSLHWEWLWTLYNAAGHYFILIMKWMAALNPDMNFSLPGEAGLLLTGMAVLFSVALIYRWVPGKKAAYLLGLAALITMGFHRSAQWSTNELIIYHQYQGLLIDVITDGRCISIQDSRLNEKNIAFAARGNRCYRDVINTIDIDKKDSYVSPSWRHTPPSFKCATISMLIWNGNTPSGKDENSFTHILTDQLPDVEALQDFICTLPAIYIILPAHIKRYHKNRLVTFFIENNIDYWDISQQGYFRLAI